MKAATSCSLPGLASRRASNANFSMMFILLNAKLRKPSSPKGELVHKKSAVYAGCRTFIGRRSKGALISLFLERLKNLTRWIVAHAVHQVLYDVISLII